MTFILIQLEIIQSKLDNEILAARLRSVMLTAAIWSVQCLKVRSTSGIYFEFTAATFSGAGNNIDFSVDGNLRALPHCVALSQIANSQRIAFQFSWNLDGSRFALFGAPRNVEKFF